MHPMTVMKEELKEKGRLIRTLKNNRKEKSENYDRDACWKVKVEKRNYRHKHIAYCLVRGRSYEQIEPKTREDNKPNWDLISHYQGKLQVAVDEHNAAWQLARQRQEVVNE